MFNVISGLFSALVSKCPVTLKHLAVEQNRLKFGTRGLLVVHLVHIRGNSLSHPAQLLSINKGHLCKFASVTAVSNRKPRSLPFFFILILYSCSTGDSGSVISMLCIQCTCSRADTNLTEDSSISKTCWFGTYFTDS